MDGVSAAATILGILQISKQIIEWTVDYSSSVLHASSEAKALSNELKALNIALANVLNQNSGSELEKIRALFESCYQDVVLMGTRLSVSYTGARKVARSLIWPFRHKEYQEHLTKLQRWIQLFSLALTNESLSRIQDVTKTALHIDDIVVRTERLALSTEERVRTIQQQQALQKQESERQKVLEWLLQVNYTTNHKKATRLAYPSSGQWFFNEWQYMLWLSEPVASENARLWLPGSAGLGKTVLMSMIINNVTKHFQSINAKRQSLPPIGVAYYYFDFNDGLKQTPELMLMTVMRQLLEYLDHVPRCISELRDQVPTGALPDVEDLIACLFELAGFFDSIVLLFDAVDEAKPTMDVVNVIVQLVKSLPSKTRFLITSRDDLSLRRSLMNHRFGIVSISRADVDQDITNYVKHASETELRTRFMSLPQSLRKKIVDTVTGRANGMFLWARWQLHEICAGKTIGEVEKALAAIPNGINDTYARVLLQIEDVDCKWVQRALFWVNISFCQLDLAILNGALAMNLDTCRYCADDQLIDDHTILGLCRSLIVVENDRVSLTHLSLKEFLATPQAGAYCLRKEVDAHETAAKVCLRYIMSGKYDSAMDPNVSGLQHYQQLFELKKSSKFLAYCCHWGFQHMKAAYTLKPESFQVFLTILLQIQETRFQRSFHFLDLIKSESEHSKFPEQSFPNVEISFGAKATVSYGVLSLSWNSSLVTRLIASKNFEFANALTSSRTNLSEPDEEGWSALCWAAAFDDTSMLQSLLSAAASKKLLNSQIVGSALIVAIGTHSERNGLMLLQNLTSLQANTSDTHISLLQSILLLLLCAVGNNLLLGHVLDMMGEKRTASELQADDGVQIGFVLAAANGLNECFQLLLTRGLRPDLQFQPRLLNRIWSARVSNLFKAANFVCLGRELTEEESDPASSWQYKAMTLDQLENVVKAALAAKHIGILQMLEKADLSPWEIVPEWQLRANAFTEAYQHKNLDEFETVRFMVEQLLVNNESSNKHQAHLDQALLWCAGMPSRCKPLWDLLRTGANANVQSNDLMWNALTLAARSGNVEGLKVLLSFGANPNSCTTTYPCGPVSAVVDCSRLDRILVMLRELVQAGASSTVYNRDTAKPIMVKLCSLSGISDMLPVIALELLLHGADPNTLAYQGPYGSALIAACGLNDIDLVQLLLRYGALPNLEAECGKYGTALIAACHYGEVEVVKALLDAGADAMLMHTPRYKSFDSTWSGKRPHEQYNCALIAAAASGSIDVIELLLQSDKRLDLNTVIRCNEYKTPLIAAVAHHYQSNSALLEQLIKLGADVNFCVPDSPPSCRLAPVAAILNRRRELIPLLLNEVTVSSVQAHPDLWSAALIAIIVDHDLNALEALLSLHVPLNENVEHLDFEGRKYGLPIIAAAAKGNMTVFARLVQCGARTDWQYVGKFGNCLTAAVRSDNEELVSHLLHQGADPNIVNANRKYWSPFIPAVYHGQSTIYKLLLRFGGNPDVFYDFTNGAFNKPDLFLDQHHRLTDRFAALEMKRDWKKTYVFKRASTGRPSKKGVDHVFGHPLIVAILSGRLDLLDEMLAFGIDVNLTTSSGRLRSAFSAAFYEGCQIEAARSLMLASNADPAQEVPGDIFGSGIIAATDGEDCEGIELLQEFGIHIESGRIVRDCERGSLLIGASCRHKSAYDDTTKELRFIRVLLDEGCKPSDKAPGSLYGNALIAAAAHLRMDLVREFIKREPGLSINSHVDEGLFGYPLLAAIARDSLNHGKFKYNFRDEKEKLTFVLALLEMGADPNVTFHHRTPLITTVERVRNFDIDILTALLDRGADPNVIVPRGWTDIYDDVSVDEEQSLGQYCALIAAIEHEKHDLVKVLLDHGADPKMLPQGYELPNLKAENGKCGHDEEWMMNM